MKKILIRLRNRTVKGSAPVVGIFEFQQMHFARIFQRDSVGEAAGEGFPLSFPERGSIQATDSAGIGFRIFPWIRNVDGTIHLRDQTLSKLRFRLRGTSNDCGNSGQRISIFPTERDTVIAHGFRGEFEETDDIAVRRYFSGKRLCCDNRSIRSRNLNLPLLPPFCRSRIVEPDPEDRLFTRQC